MVDTLKVLGQSMPNANSLTDIYIVPSSTQATISSIVICNQVNSDTNFRVSIAIGGAADIPAQYLYYDLFLDSNDTFTCSIGISLASNDVVRAQSGNGNVSFNIFGVELS